WSPLYLIPMVTGAAVFLLLSVVQLAHEYWRRWRESLRYGAELRAAALRLIQLYTDQQVVSSTIDPELSTSEAVEHAARCDGEQAELIARFVSRSLTQRLRRRRLTAASLGLKTFSERTSSSSDHAALLERAGCDLATRRPGLPHPRLWERRPGDPDFLALRLGTGEQPASFQIEAPTASELPLRIVELTQRFARVRQLPQTCSLPEVGSLGVVGPRELSVPLAHALLWQVAVHHAPSEVRIAAIYRPERRATWAWLRWLPHTLPLNGDRRRRLLAVREPQVEELMIALLDELSHRRDRAKTESSPPQIILLIDDERAQQRSMFNELLRRGKEYGINCIVLAETWELLPGACGATVRLNSERMASIALSGGQWSAPFTAVQADPRQSETLSRALTPLVLVEMGGSREIPRNVRLLDLLRARADGEFNPARLWTRPLPEAWHPDVPIGRGEGGELIYLDLRQFCDGPHGIIAGMTGAGKSELLQAIIAALAATHAPDRVQFLLIDFKGGAALRDFAELPHTVGLVTDLQGGHLAERAITAMRSELLRRKNHLAEYKAKDIGEYRALQPRPPALANLLIVIDEFDTTVKEQPGFVAELITIVKQGRSLGVHLLVASQEPSTAVKDEIKSQLQYWLALRLRSVRDSREMLDRPDASFLPSDLPGRAYKRVGMQIVPFQAPRVSAPFQSIGDDDEELIATVDPDTGEAIPHQPSARGDAIEDDRPKTDLRFIVEEIKRAGVASVARAIWCPPLPSRLTLTQEVAPGLTVLPGEVVQCAQGRGWWSGRPQRRLVLPIGLLDLPQESRQEIVEVNLSSGHLLVLGAPGSGKTMLLRTLLTTLALNHSPADVWCYLIDAGGQGLSAFRTMPHVGGLVHVREVDQVRRVIWMVQRTLEAREQAQRSGEASALPISAQPSDEQPPALLLIIDKFALFREEYESAGLIDELIALAAQGRAYDIHLVVTADRPGDVPYKLQGLFDTQLLLRQGDENDALALTGRRAAGQIPLDQPGRGYQLTAEQGWAELQVALPYLVPADEPVSAEAVNNLLDREIIANARGWMEAAAEAWRALPQAQVASPPPVRLLPEHIAFATLWHQAASQERAQRGPGSGLDMLVGLEAQTLGLARLTLKETAPAALVVGGFQSGKTTALRTMLRSLALRSSPDEVRLVLVDPRRSSFRNLAIGPHEPLYATSEAHLAELAEQLDQAMEEPTPRQRWVVCIDDFDIGQSQFTTQFQKPFSGQKTFLVVLEKLVSLGRERGFGLMVAANTSSPTQLLGQLSAGRYGLILQPHNFPPATNLLGVRLPIPASGRQIIPGRGLLVSNNLQQWVQVAAESEEVLS
ncbi:MAG: hypothetical protein HGA45_22970, partial [Chloroflexales bacterium]|nr:hypothetical protein [Chloroflexales bacterium]